MNRWAGIDAPARTGPSIAGVDKRLLDMHAFVCALDQQADDLEPTDPARADLLRRQSVAVRREMAANYYSGGKPDEKKE